MVRSQILLLDPLPSANRIFSMIIQHERQQSGPSPSASAEANPFVNATSSKGRSIPHQGGSKTRKCDYCGRIGHTINSCFQKNNIPPPKCSHCDRPGHTEDVCYSKFGYPSGYPKYPGHPRPFNKNVPAGSSVNSAASPKSGETHTLPHSGSKGASPLGLNITQAQLQHLMNLLKATGSGGSSPDDTPSRANLSHSSPSQPDNSGFGSRFIFSVSTTHTLNTFSHTTPWIIDSGATDHISTSLNYFFKYSEIKPLNIHLPNGSIVQVHMVGSIKFSPDFIIHDVLYVPNFTFNLLSLPKLLTTNPYRITFSNESSKILCQIQDMNTLRLIGSTDLKEGLFHLTIRKERSLSINNATATTINNSNLWHFKLGHPSSNRLNVLNEQFPFISKHSNEICDICHFAKQKKLPYSPSSSRGSKNFDLIHMGAIFKNIYTWTQIFSHNT